MIAPSKEALNKIFHHEQNTNDRQIYSHPRVIAAKDQSDKLRYKTGKYGGTILVLKRILFYSLSFIKREKP